MEDAMQQFRPRDKSEQKDGVPFIRLYYYLHKINHVRSSRPKWCEYGFSKIGLIVRSDVTIQRRACYAGTVKGR